MIIASIDYSMTCPALCVHDTDNPFTFENCDFFFLTDKNYLEGRLMPNVYGTLLKKKDYSDDTTRFAAISNWVMKTFLDRDLKVEHVGLEGYSFGSSGKVFNIGENTGILKYRLWMQDIPLEIYAPKEIKMLAVNNTPVDTSEWNKNKIDKDRMFEIFLEETSTNLQEILTPKKKKIDSPVGDIVDSYYICKLLREKLENVTEDSTESQN